MESYLILLRGINVGGKNILPMKELRALLEELGAREIRTYIQSGNIVLGHESRDPVALGLEISATIEKAKGFAPRTLVLTAERFRAASAANPFPEAETEPKSLHLSFFENAPSAPNLGALEALAKKNERFQLGEDCFYLHAPDGIGRSKLAAKVEQALGVPATARNWRTVQKLLDMLG